jgi:ElaB/YqjD/DUF883 family membrane-anchored ribosome-binding protein
MRRIDETQIDRRVTGYSAEPGSGISAETEQICEEIEETRAEMSETLAAIQERLSPSYIKEQVKEQARDQIQELKQAVRDATVGKVEHMLDRANDVASDSGRTMIATVKANPIPFALIGIGACWLWWNNRSASNKDIHNGRGYLDRRQFDSNLHLPSAEVSHNESSGIVKQVSDVGNRIQTAVGDTVDQARETAANLSAKTKETVNNAVNRTQETAAHAVDVAKDQARRAQDQFSTVLHENPLAIGMTALAVGIGVGLVLPQTRKENQWMGDARERVVDKAQSVSADAMDKFRDVADRVSEEMVGQKGRESQMP